MFKVNRKVEYALIALRHISQFPDRLVSAKEICDTYLTPFDTTSRVLQIMVQHNIVKAEHGAYGGYKITKDLSTITFSELVEMIVGPMHIADCFQGGYSQCDITAKCNVIAPMLNLNDRMAELFQTISVSELLQSRHQGDRTIRSRYIEKHPAVTK